MRAKLESDMKETIYLRVIEELGASGVAAELKVRQNSVSNWRTRGIPAHRVPAVSELTGLSYNALRPDLFPAEDA